MAEAARRIFDALVTDGLRCYRQILEQMVAALGADAPSARTVLRWLAEALNDCPGVQSGWAPPTAARLSSRKGRRPASGSIDRDPEVRAFIVSLAADGQVSAARIHDALCRQFGAQRTPRVRAIQRWVAAWARTNAATLAWVRDPDQWKSRHRLSIGRMDADVSHINQLWEMDSTIADVMLMDGDGTVRRHALVQIIDVRTRRMLLHVARTSSSRAIAAALRKAMLAWGVPVACKMDNGPDYVSGHISGALTALGVEIKLCPPGSPDRKPHVERAFGTFTRDLVPLLPNFVGHDIAERKAIELRKRRDGLTIHAEGYDAAWFQQFCDNWCAVYAERVHSGIGRSPAVAAAVEAHAARRVTDERALDILLSPLAGARVVGKRGLRVEGGVYFAPELIPFVGQSVLVRLDDGDLSCVHVFTDRGLYVCAARDLTRAGIDRADLAREMRRRQNEDKARATREIRAAQRRYTKQDAVAALLDVRPTNVVAFPGKAAEGPALNSPALNTIAPPEPVDLDALSAQAARLFAQRSAPVVQVPAPQDDPAARVARRIADADATLAAHARGEFVAPDTLRAAAAYAASAEYRAHKLVVEHIQQQQKGTA